MCVKKIIAAAMLIAFAAVAGLNIGADPSDCRRISNTPDFQAELFRRAAL